MTYGPPNQQFPGPGSPFGAQAQTANRRNRRLTLILAAIVAILAVVVGVGALKIYSDKTGKDLFPMLTLRASDDAGPDPFTSSVSLAQRTGTLTNRV